jgi:hypothetical protein
MDSVDSNDSRSSIDPFKDHRFIFVQLLFSLAIAEVARQTAHVYLKHGIDTLNVWTSYTHLLLALIVIATSWLGWRLSERNQRIHINSVFNSAFWVLILDVLCVVAYFVLARGVEGGDQDTALSIKPSATHEAIWLVVVFILYAAWDVLTKAASHGDGLCTSLRRLGSWSYFGRGWVSLLCLLMALIDWYMLRELSNPWSVICADGALILLVLTFRRLKERPPDPRAKSVSTQSLVWGIIVFVLWIGATVGATVIDRVTSAPPSITAMTCLSSTDTSTKQCVYIVSHQPLSSTPCWITGSIMPKPLIGGNV